MISKSESKCKAIAERIEKKFAEIKEFQDILNFTTVFQYNSNRYTIEINNSNLEGVDQTTVQTVKDCEAPGKNSLSMKIQFNLGNPRIVSETYYKNVQDKDAERKKIEVASYASSDLIYEAQVHYNNDWKRVVVTYVALSKVAQFVSDSDCEDGIQFCDALHSKLDQIVPNQLYNRVPYFMKQVLFRMEL